MFIQRCLIGLLFALFAGLPPASASAQEAKPPASAPATQEKTAPVLPAKGTYRITGTAESLSVFSVSVDAPELFTALADRAGLRLVVDDTVSRRITVNISRKPAREVVHDIVSAYGLSSAEVEGVIMISEGIPRSPSSYLLSEIDSVPTRYVNAANARNLLPVFLQDYVKVNFEQNAVVLSAPSEVLRKFRQDIAQFDIPAAQIMVDLLLVELTETGVEELGLKLNWQNNGAGISADAGTGNLIYRAVTTLPDLFGAQLQALEEKGRARVNANPRIATVSGRRASIFVGRQRYIVTPIENQMGGQRNFIDAGVRLRITPYTGGDGQVLVDVDAEVSTLSAIDPLTRLPEKSTRTARTTVRVNHGQTIVIGGLVQEERREVRTRVPLLGDIPLIGSLFRTKDVRNTRTELMLFITPRVLSDTGHLPEQEELDMKGRLLDPELNRMRPSRPTASPKPPSEMQPDRAPKTPEMQPDAAPPEKRR